MLIFIQVCWILLVLVVIVRIYVNFHPSLCEMITANLPLSTVSTLPFTLYQWGSMLKFTPITLATRVLFSFPLLSFSRSLLRSTLKTLKLLNPFKVIATVTLTSLYFSLSVSFWKKKKKTKQNQKPVDLSQSLWFWRWRIRKRGVPNASESRLVSGQMTVRIAFQWFMVNLCLRYLIF